MLGGGEWDKGTESEGQGEVSLAVFLAVPSTGVLTYSDHRLFVLCPRTHEWYFLPVSVPLMPSSPDGKQSIVLL